MCALMDEQIVDPRMEKSLTYLAKSLSAQTPTASLAYGILGLAAHGRRPPDADAWLDHAQAREMAGSRSPYKLALLAAAAEAGKLLASLCPSLTPIWEAD
jgi:hypothetical protein